MNEIAKHKAAIEDADTQNKVCNPCTSISAEIITDGFTPRGNLQSTCDSSVKKWLLEGWFPQGVKLVSGSCIIGPVIL